MKQFYAAIFLINAVLMASLAIAADRDLGLASFRPLTFANKTPTKYLNRGDELVMQVDESASALIQPFSAPMVVKSLSFEWRSSGDLKVASAAIEQAKAGDDFRLRIGLILAGPAPLIPFFAPGWIKALRGMATLSSDHVRYFVVGTQTKPGGRWSSAYSDSMDYVALESVVSKDRWSRAQIEFAPVNVVGLWLMADGDDTKSTFETSLQHLSLR